MMTSKRRRVSDVVRGFYLLCHPVPVLFHLLAVTLLALLAAWPQFVWSTIGLVVTAHTAMQISIAVLNDYCDRRLDAFSKRNKPLVKGLVRPWEALALGLGMIVVMTLLLLPLNRLALFVSFIYLAFGISYNLGLKSTPLSGIVFALAIPLIPVYAFVGVGRIIPLIFWIIPVAALLGVAVNLANSLADIEEDAANNARTLAVVLGFNGTYTTCPLLIMLAVLLAGILTLTHLVPAQLFLLVPTILLVSALITLLILLGRSGRSVQAQKHYFVLVVVICLVFAGGWLGSVFI